MFRMGECAIAHGIIKAAMIRSPLVRRTASWQLLGITAQLCLRPSPNLLPHPCSGEIHTVFPPFYNFRMRQNLWPNALAKLCGAAFILGMVLVKRNVSE